MGDFPVIRLTVESMKCSILAALSTRHDELQYAVEDAVARYCTDGNLRSVIDEQARVTIDAAVKEEVSAFFRYGAGRAVVKEAVLAHLQDAFGKETS